MNQLQRLPMDGLKAQFETLTLKELEQGLAPLHSSPSGQQPLISLPNDSESERLKVIDKVYAYVTSHARYQDNQITAKSLRVIQSKLINDEKHGPIFRLVLNLLLFFIEKQTGIRAPEIGTTVMLKQPLPTLTPDVFFQSELADAIYQLIESNQTLGAYLDEPENNVAYLCLWLMLKEGITREKDLHALLANQSSLYRLNSDWCYQNKHHRQWLSKKATLLLSVWFQHQRPRIRSLTSTIHRYLAQHNLLSYRHPLGLLLLRQMFKLEYVMVRSSVEYKMFIGAITSTALSDNAMTRLMSNTPIQNHRPPKTKLVATVRQQRHWRSGFTPNQAALRQRVPADIEEIAPSKQIQIIRRFTQKLTSAPPQKISRVSTEVLKELQNKLEDKSRIRSRPFCWLLLAWLYHLLKNGGKFKSHLRLKTVAKYINGVSVPFITEFAGCDPEQMNELDWAEKLNLVIESISSPQAKAFVAYFAEFLIDSELVPELCLSDIDLPAAEHNADANIITHIEAERVLKCLQRSKHPRAELARLLFTFGFYLGLRRNEIRGLQFKDFHHNQELHHTLHVRPNKYRLLKSTDGSRNLPIETLLPAPNFNEMMAFLETTKLKHMDRATPIFHAFSDIQINEAFVLVTSVMRGVTGDETLRFHHCRHSFCNWTLCLLYQVNQTGKWPFLCHDYFSAEQAQALRARLGIAKNTRKQFWVVSELLGHASPSTTISSYFHLADVFHRSFFATHLPEPFAVRKVWGQRTPLDACGNPILKPTQQTEYAELQPPEVRFDAVTEPFDVSQLEPSQAQPVSESLTIIDVWRVIRRAAEGQTPEIIANDLSLSLPNVHNILIFEQDTREYTQRFSKHPAKAMVNYHALDTSNIKELEQWIRAFHHHENAVKQTLKLPLLQKSIETFVGAKDAKIRTHDKDVALTLLKMLTMLDMPNQIIEVKWYMTAETITSTAQLTPYLKHIDFWKTALVQHLGMSEQHFSILLPHTHKMLKAHFAIKAHTTLSDDGKYLKYKAPGYVSIEVKQTRFVSDALKPNDAKSRPRRRKSFVSFLRLLVIYLKAAS
ncbi:hypothetical protein HGP28_15230 [Vibrio sp. SM6]|uniref:Tyr recombinase domain-containing protein n=1 Tax=Vibrio agarilyticus TaxID=2726741 RepID=A0A7X8TTA0_9VIBR|nr:site-specific integrase [Vibrio agarilyticus]NLS14236.1 hypothetical protein [Vibrio agarilyticus]